MLETRQKLFYNKSEIKNPKVHSKWSCKAEVKKAESTPFCSLLPPTKQTCMMLSNMQAPHLYFILSLRDTHPLKFVCFYQMILPKPLKELPQGSPGRESSLRSWAGSQS